MNSKKEILDKLFYETNQQRDFLVCGLHKQGDKVISTKWKKYSEVCFPIDANEDYKINWVNQRQILPQEIVLDLESPDQLKPTIQKLRELDLVFHCYSTGSRGFHIHILFNQDLSEQEKSGIISFFGADGLKAASKTMIALENCPHWKSGEIKGEI
jgi:DNA primase catalytic subunit